MFTAEQEFSRESKDPSFLSGIEIAIRCTHPSPPTSKAQGSNEVQNQNPSDSTGGTIPGSVFEFDMSIPPTGTLGLVLDQVMTILLCLASLSLKL